MNELIYKLIILCINKTITINTNIDVWYVLQKKENNILSDMAFQS